MFENTLKNKLSPHFTIDELTYSRTAVENGLDNTPPETALAALKQLVENLLEPLRECLGSPIAVTSGYRSPEVNRLVGGVATSQHTKGEAADCYTAAGPRHLLNLLVNNKIPFDQAILYRKKNFLHVSYRKSRNRGEILYK